MPTGVYKRTEEHKRKISEANKGRKISEEHKRKMSEAQKGRKHTEETKKKIREKRKLQIITKEHRRKIKESMKLFYQNGGVSGMKGKEVTKEHRRKLSKANKGRKKPPQTKEHRKKLSKAKKLFFQNGGISAMKGKKHTKETRKKISEANSGEKSGCWQGGISFEPYTIDWTKTLRKSIRERDKYTCRLCGKFQGSEIHSVHHIDYDKKNCNPDNLVTLCRSCHSKTNKNRAYWIRYFKDPLQKITPEIEERMMNPGGK